jgi:bacteriocin-like protein
MSNKSKEGTTKIGQFDETAETVIRLQNPACMIQPEQMPKSSTSRRSLKFKVMLEELNYKEMNQITGGVSVEEYCATLTNMMDGEYAKTEWTAEQWTNAWNAYSKHCK